MRTISASNLPAIDEYIQCGSSPSSLRANFCQQNCVKPVCLKCVYSRHLRETLLLVPGIPCLIVERPAEKWVRLLGMDGKLYPILSSRSLFLRLGASQKLHSA